MHAGVQRLVRDLNHLYRSIPALHELDCETEGFEWIDCHDAEQSVISYIRRSKGRNQFVVIVCNFTPVVRHNYRIGVSRGGYYRERVNTNSGRMAAAAWEISVAALLKLCLVMANHSRWR